MRLDPKMVQVPSYPPTREGWQQQTRQHEDPNGRYPLPMRLATASVHDRLLTVTQAVRSCAGVPVKEYALVAILDNGEARVFCSSQQAKINAEPVLHELRRAAALGPDIQQPSAPREGVWSSNPIDLETSFESQYRSGSEGRRRRRQVSQVKAEDSDDADSRRKRPKGRRESLMSSTPINTARTQQIRIGDSDRLAEFYAGRWRDLQQTACKIVGKAFVKLIEPKKQTHHPYTKGDAFAPDWWPSCTGENPTRHKEPDHLYKRERVRLCDHVLSLVVQPNHKQMECFRHLNLNVKKLEEFTMEQMKSWFNNAAHPKNKEKRKYLKEIFKVAKQQERYLDGQIDANTYVNVMFGQDFRRNAVDYTSSSDDDSDTEADEDTTRHAQDRPQNPNLGLVLQTQPEYIAPLQHQPQHFEVGPIYEQPRNFGTQNPMTIEHDRRSFGSSPAYSQGSNSYAWTPSPAGSMGSTPPSTFYTTSPQVSNPITTGYQMGQAPSMPAILPPLQQNFEAAPRYDMNSMNTHQDSLRQETMGHPNIPHVNTSFADNMFTSTHYAPQNEPVYHPHH